MDYKHHIQRTRQEEGRDKKANIPGWLWFIAGLLLGISMLAIAQILQKNIENKPTQQPNTQNTKQPATKPDKQNSQIPEKPVVPQFEFYSVLPEMEIEVPPESLHPSASHLPASPASDQTRTIPGSSVYQLQIASYRARGDAEYLQKRLNRLGISSVIERASVNEKYWYRIRSGPYSKEQAYSLHQRLKRQKLNSLILRIKKK